MAVQFAVAAAMAIAAILTAVFIMRHAERASRLRIAEREAHRQADRLRLDNERLAVTNNPVKRAKLAARIGVNSIDGGI